MPTEYLNDGFYYEIRVYCHTTGMSEVNEFAYFEDEALRIANQMATYKEFEDCDITVEVYDVDEEYLDEPLRVIEIKKGDSK